MTRFIVFVLLVLLLLSACSNSEPEAESDSIIITELTVIAPTLSAPVAESAYPGAVNPIPQDPEAYPAPQVNEPISPYPSGEAPPPTDLPVVATVGPLELPTLPEPAAGKGVVAGRVIQAETNEPGYRAPVYLGARVEVDPGDGYFISTQRNSSPHIDADEGGYFIITDVEPGIYAVVIRTPIGSKVLTNPDTNDAYWVEVVADQVFEVGDVYFQLP